MNISQVYSVVGEVGFTRLAAAFYRQVYDDDILGPMYPKDDREGAEQRLRDFLIYAFGGSQRYFEQRGHPRMRVRHARFRIDRIARERWMQLMDNALAETALPEETERDLRGFFAKMSAILINQPETPNPQPSEHLD
jgi:hemoglobin